MTRSGDQGDQEPRRFVVRLAVLVAARSLASLRRQLRHVDGVEVTQLSTGLTALAIAAPHAGTALLVGLFVSACRACLMTGYPK